MYFTVTEGYFSSEDQAYAEIARRGWFAKASTTTEDAELHWHDFDAVAFIVEGTARAEYQDGTFLTAGVGARVEAPAGIAHRNLGPSWKQIVGVSVDPAKMTQPVNKVVTTAKD
jgi:hypothetical protein